MICNDNSVKTVAITGHARGIGKAFSRWFTDHGHAVVGMSRSNGFDIKDTKTILDQAEHCDVFVNNAWQDFDQSLLLYHLHDRWFGDRSKLIIVISSARSVKPTEYHTHDPDRNLYKNSKRSLEESCVHLWNHNPWPRICLFRPGHTDTDFTATSTRPKMDADQLISYFMHCITSAPDEMFLQEICIREPHEIYHLRS